MVTHAVILPTFKIEGSTVASSCLRLRADRVANGDIAGTGWIRLNILIYRNTSRMIASIMNGLQ